MRIHRSLKMGLAMGVMLVSGGCVARTAAPPPAQAPCASDLSPGAWEQAPLRIRICGRDSVAPGRSALLFVDGKEIPASRLGALDSERIESIEIMKGPPAVAVYGPRAAEGVIVVRTKRP